MSNQDVLGGLKEQLGDYAKALGRKAVNSAGERVDKLAERFEAGGEAQSDAVKAGAEELAEGKSPAKAAASAATTGVKDKVKGLFGGGSDSSGGSGGGGTDNKFMNIVEWAEVGVPLTVAYNAFTQFEDWPNFMKKVENVEWVDDVKLKFKGQVFLSHRTWEATITDQLADSHIVWRSTGEKGHISGSVTFHEVTPTLTRILTIGEYRPQGFVERTGNLWRAVGRRFRLELKFFVHHVMTEVILDPDSVEGWRGEIRDGEVVLTHEEGQEADAEALNSGDESEQDEGSEQQESEQPDSEQPDSDEGSAEEPDAEAEEEEAEDESAADEETADEDQNAS